MTREEARKAAEIMLAYAEGKEIEYRPEISDDMWFTVTEPCFDWSSTDYRIKKEPTYRPFKDKEECWNEMLKHQPFGWVCGKISGEYMNLSGIGDKKIWKIGMNMNVTFEEADNYYTFADGAPFGIREK